MEFNVFRESLVPPRFIGWKEAVEKLEQIQSRLQNELSGEKTIELLPARCFYIALLGELLTLKTVNCDKLYCPVPWKEKNGFVSLPTFAADAKYAAEFVGKNPYLQAILKSFLGWQIFSSAVKEGCSCGMSVWDARNVTYDVLVNHALFNEANSILIRQFFAIRSSDNVFLSKHFSKKNRKLCNYSKVLPDTNIVWIAENRAEVAGGNLKIAALKLDSAKEIYDPQKKGDAFFCGEYILALAKEMEEIYERNG